MEEEACTTESPVLSDSSSGTAGRRICNACWLTIVQFFLLLWKNFILQVCTSVLVCTCIYVCILLDKAASRYCI